MTSFSISHANEPSVENLGQDPSRPLARLDLRYALRDENETLDREVTTLRLDYPHMVNRWSYYFRTDFTHVENKFKGASSVLNDEGIGPTTLLAAVSYAFKGSGHDFLGADIAGVGVQTLLDTTDDELDPGSTSTTNLALVLGAKWSLGESRSFFFPVLRYWRDIEKDDNASEYDVIAFQPFFNIPFKLGDLPSFVSFYQTYDIRYNLSDEGANEKGLHLPINVGIGFMPARSLVLSVDYSETVEDKFERYDSIVEFRAGYFF